MSDYFALGIILCTIAGIGEAIMDTLAHHFERSTFSNFNRDFWDPVHSGKNKWKNGDRTQGERFYLSSTLLVGFTEAWHLFKMIRTNSLFIGIGILVGSVGFWWGMPISLIVFKLAFTAFYNGFDEG